MLTTISPILFIKIVSRFILKLRVRIVSSNSLLVFDAEQLSETFSVELVGNILKCCWFDFEELWRIFFFREKSVSFCGGFLTEEFDFRMSVV